jgi:hypothetical protein
MNGGKIMLLNGAPELEQKYHKYLLGPNEPIIEPVLKRKSSTFSKAKRREIKTINEPVKRKSSVSQSPSIPAKKVKYQEMKLVKLNSPASSPPTATTKKAKRQEIDRLVIYLSDLILTFNFSSKKNPKSDYFEIKLSFANGKPSSLNEAIKNKK